MRSKYLISLLLILLVELSSCKSSEPLESATLNEEVLRAVVRIGEEALDEDRITWSGTGFFVGDNCTIASALHVTERIRPDRIISMVQMPDGSREIRRVRVVLEDSLQDAVFLRLSRTPWSPRPEDEERCDGTYWSTMSISKARTEEFFGRDIVVIGHPVLTDKLIVPPLLRHGKVASASNLVEGMRETLIADMFSVKGFSGGPVLLEGTNIVIGIHSSTVGDRAKGFSMFARLRLSDYPEVFETAHDRP